MIRGCAEFESAEAVLDFSHSCPALSSNSALHIPNAEYTRNVWQFGFYYRLLHVDTGQTCNLQLLKSTRLIFTVDGTLS